MFFSVAFIESTLCQKRQITFNTVEGWFIAVVNHSMNFEILWKWEFNFADITIFLFRTTLGRPLVFSTPTLPSISSSGASTSIDKSFSDWMTLWPLPDVFLHSSSSWMVLDRCCCCCLCGKFSFFGAFRSETQCIVCWLITFTDLTIEKTEFVLCDWIYWYEHCFTLPKMSKVRMNTQDTAVMNHPY